MHTHFLNDSQVSKPYADFFSEASLESMRVVANPDSPEDPMEVEDNENAVHIDINGGVEPGEADWGGDDGDGGYDEDGGGGDD